jgi:hypothetical protein
MSAESYFETRVVTCECGCGRPTNPAPKTSQRNGWVEGEPMRFVRGHAGCKKGPMYRVDPETGCWVWQRGFYNTGYGSIHGRARAVSAVAHRFVYETEVGPVPEGLVLDHLCRNKACVNPDHLEPVTNAENIRRGNQAILDKPAVKEIRARHAALLKELAETYGVTAASIRNVITSQTWDGVA